VTNQRNPGTWTRVSKAAALDQRLSMPTFRVLGVLGCYADAAGRCYPSVTTIAARRGLGRRMVQYHLRRLEEFGYVLTMRQSRPSGITGMRSNGARLGGGWAPNAYQLLFPTPPSLSNPGRSAQADSRDNVQSDCAS